MGVVVTVFSSTVIKSAINNDITQKIAKELPGYIVFSLFRLAGLGLMLYPIINKYRKKKRCKYCVKATITGFERGYSNGGGGGASLYPKYEFCYKGDIYNVTHQFPLFLIKPEIGSQVDMFINEKAPYDFYAESNGFELFLIAFGFLFFWGMCIGVSDILSA